MNPPTSTFSQGSEDSPSQRNRAGFRTIAFCEIDKYCQKILAKNFLADSEQSIKDRTRSTAGHTASMGTITHELPRIHGNIFDLDGTQFRRNGCNVTLLTGGFPCQPFSVAGKRRGAADDRAIWPEMFRVIKEARPAWVLGENVPGIIPMELDNVLSDLESIGYACRAFVIPACAVDARHRRDRLWIVGRNMADSGESGLARCGHESGEQEATTRFGTSNGRRWLPEPDVGRVAHGIPKRVDRLKGPGNAIVPAVAYEILREIRKLI
jgi:DNA (cytosine-5)-methyltransferase 1